MLFRVFVVVVFVVLFFLCFFLFVCLFVLFFCCFCGRGRGVVTGLCSASGMCLSLSVNIFLK